VADLSEAGEINLALQLAQIVREPEARSRVITAIARNLIETRQEADEETKELILEMVKEN